MSILWQPAPAPFIDPNGRPYVGALAFFFDASTTTPRVVYIDPGMGIPHDHPVVANAAGMFPAVFLPSGDYRLRIETAQGVTLWDVDGITTPGSGSGGGGGGTGPDDPTSVAATGDLKWRYGLGSINGWVRLNGRTIGNSSSGATERSSPDCEALFEYLWVTDANLAVSGGRGAAATGDWAANKRIALPDWRGRAPITPTAFGAADNGLIPSSLVDGSGTANDLGASAGAARVTLTTAQMPSHRHTGTTSEDGEHTHRQRVGRGYRDTNNSIPGAAFYGDSIVNTTASTGPDGLHTHTFQTNLVGSGEAHANMQPSRIAGFYIKL